MLKSTNNERRRPRIPGRVHALMAGGLAAAVLLAGCTAGDGEEPATGGGTVTVGTITHTRPPSATITRTVTAAAPTGDTVGTAGSKDPAVSSGSETGGSEAPASSVVQSPASAAAPVTNEPDPQAGNCPYLSDADAKKMTGQGTGQTVLIDVDPAPICVFQRSDGGWLAVVRPVAADSEAAAVAAVDGHIPRAESSPADDPDGWTGGYMTLPDGTADYPKARSVYGVSKGELAIIVWTNQEQTVKGRRIAETAIGALGW